MDDSFKNEAQRLVDAIKKKTNNEDLLVFHSTLDTQNPLYQIDDTDPHVFETLIKAEKKSDILNLLIHTRGGRYDCAIEIHKILRDNYKVIKVVVPSVAMSCGTALSMMADELFLHQNCSMGAFDPQILISPTYPPVGLYSLLKSFGINKPNIAKPLTNGSLGAIPAAAVKLIDDAHSDYYAIEGYLQNAMTNCRLINNADIPNILNRFYKDDHQDYGSHGKRIDFGTFRHFVPAAKPLALHSDPASLKDLFILCEELINKYSLARVYILNNKFSYR